VGIFPPNSIFVKPYFTNPSIKHLCELYVERNFSLWRDPDTVQWVKKGKEKILAGKNNGVEQDVWLKELSKEFSEGNQTNLFSHLILSGG
jgi:hypothetical protein